MTAPDQLTNEEKFVVDVVRMNRTLPKREINKEIQLGRLRVKLHWSSKKNLWGRFGGGWNWKLGFQCGGGTLIVDMLVFNVRFDWRKP